MSEIRKNSMPAIAGSGGGKGGGGGASYTPSEEPDSLESTQYATVIDILSEGEIAGLVDGNKSIFLDNTPLQDKNGTYNFKNVQLIVRNGTQDQSYIPFAPDPESEIPVNVTVLNGTPVTRTITDQTVDAVRVTISVPVLQQFGDKGDIYGASVRLQISVQYNGGGFQVKIDDTISGRTADLYQRAYLLNLNGNFPVDIRVTRVSPNGTSSRLSNDIVWTGYTEITRAKLRYPNSALVGWRIDAQQFSNVPSRSYDIHGIKVHIPSNGVVQPDGRIVYTGTWNGVFSEQQYTSDPAWCLWDLLTSTRYGFGDHILTPAEKASFVGQASRLDKWAFYAASKYCGELVDDGFGGKEARFSCNALIQSPQDAYKLIGDMCSVFRAMPFWAAGSATVSQDRPSDPVYLFNSANVIDGVFEYSSSSFKNRPTVVVVAYYDITLRDTAYEVVEDQAKIAVYGSITREVDGFACISRGQARRIGEWILYSEWEEGEVVSFSVGIEAGVIVRPGHVISVADPLRLNSRSHGRISSATATTVLVDSATGLSYVSGSTLSVILPNGLAESRPVTGLAGRTFTVSPPFSVAPNANSVWIYDTPTSKATTWRVVGVEERDGIEYGISAISHNPSKYAHIERGEPLQPRITSPLTTLPNPPTSASAEEVFYAENGVAKVKIRLSWQPVPGVSQYRVMWRYESGNWTTATATGPEYEILDSTNGIYHAKIYSVNTSNLRSSTSPAEISAFSAAGKTAPPQAPTGISLIPIDKASAILSWDRAPELDVLLGGKVLIRHNSAMVDAIWQESQEIVAAAAGSQTQKQVPLLNGTYLIKFEDDGGRRSASAATAVATLPEPQPRLLIENYREDQASKKFGGETSNMVYDSGYDALMLAIGIPVDDLAADGDWDALTSVDGEFLAGTGLYTFANTLDLGGVYDINLLRHFKVRSIFLSQLIDSQTTDIDTWGSIFGTGDDLVPDYVGAKMCIRATSDDPGGTPAWSDWVEFANATTRGRAFQFQVMAYTTSADQTILIDELGATIEMEQRTESIGPLATTTAPLSVAFAQPFYVAPVVGITAYNMGTGEYYIITSISRNGFTIAFYSSTGSAIARQFSYTAVGYGREIV